MRSCELADEPDREAAIAALQDKVPLIVVTCGSEGAMAVERGRRASVPIARLGSGVVDTTGAGDLFAAGFLVGQAQGRSLEDSLRMGSIAAAEVISHFGARPEADLRTLVATCDSDFSSSRRRPDLAISAVPRDPAFAGMTR